LNKKLHTYKNGTIFNLQDLQEIASVHNQSAQHKKSKLNKTTDDRTLCPQCKI